MFHRRLPTVMLTPASSRRFLFAGAREKLDFQARRRDGGGHATVGAIVPAVLQEEGEEVEAAGQRRTNTHTGANPG